MFIIHFQSDLMFCIFQKISKIDIQELSRFFRIIIRIYLEARVQHNKPYFHAYYQENVAIYWIDPIELISGSLPLGQSRFVEAWAELHITELIISWERLQNGQLPIPIEPLK